MSLSSLTGNEADAAGAMSPGSSDRQQQPRNEQSPPQRGASSSGSAATAISGAQLCRLHHGDVSESGSTETPAQPNHRAPYREKCSRLATLVGAPQEGM
ncbi:hypothetical protein MTO96_020397 [Rhipicephalus appendiculatus]